MSWFEALVPDDPRVTSRPMFGNRAAFVNGNMFVALFGDRVAIRLPEEAREELAQVPGADSFEPMPGRAMKEYVVLPQAWREDLPLARAWVDRSLAWTGELPAKRKK